MWKNLHVQSCQVALDLTETEVVKVRVQDQSPLLVCSIFQAIIYVCQHIHLYSHFSRVPHAINVTAKC
jgi:hypothetical protein